MKTSHRLVSSLLQLRGMLVLLMAGLLLSGCVWNWEDFPTVPPREPDVDMPEMDMEMEMEMPPSVVDMDMDMPPDRNSFGWACEEDNDCNSGLCAEGVCSVSCQEDRDCPGGGVCASLTSGNVCVRDCGTDGQCPDEATSCVRWVTRTSSLFSQRIQHLCLIDSDGDGVHDQADNCPDDFNPEQVDSTGDGVGDVCAATPDGTPSPHCAHGVGVWDYDDLTLVVDGFQAALAGRYLYLVGSHRNDEPSDTAVILDRFTGTYQTVMMEQGARDFAIAARGDALILSPGSRGAFQQFGQILRMSPDGQVMALDEPFEFGPGPYHWGFARDGSFWVRDGQQLDRWSWEGLERDFYFSVPLQVNRSHVNPDGSVSFYGWEYRGDSTEINEQRIGPGERVELSSLSVEGSIRPVLVPAPGGVHYLYDQDTGSAYLSPEDGDGVWMREPALDVDVSDFPDAHFLPLPRGPGMVIVSHSQENLKVRSVSLACDEQARQLDRDGDGIPDVEDLCPLVAPESPESGHGDLDGDWVGDECDPDIDGDGFDNELEMALGTDPRDPISLPDGGVVVWLEDDGTTKRIYRRVLAGGELEEIATGEDLYGVGARDLEVFWLDRSNLGDVYVFDGEMVSIFASGVEASGVAIDERFERGFFLTTEDGTLRSYDALGTGGLTTEFSGLQRTWRPISQSTGLTMLGRPFGCSDCIRAYRAMAGGVVQVIAPDLLNVYDVSLTRAGVEFLVADAVDGAVHRVLTSDRREFPRPEKVEQVMMFRITPMRGLMLGAPRFGSKGLWFYNRSTGSWNELPSMGGDILEIAFVEEPG